MKVYRVQNQSFPIRVEFNGMTQRLTVEAGKELSRELAKVTEPTPEPSLDVVERIRAAMQGPIVSGLAKWRRDELVGILATIIEAEVERRVRERSKE